MVSAGENAAWGVPSSVCEVDGRCFSKEQAEVVHSSVALCFSVPLGIAHKQH